ncbi:MAG: hypothetical protein ABIC04_03380 [Nanoarchaeota archaeon]
MAELAAGLGEMTRRFFLKLSGSSAASAAVKRLPGAAGIISEKDNTTEFPRLQGILSQFDDISLTCIERPEYTMANNGTKAALMVNPAMEHFEFAYASGKTQYDLTVRKNSVGALIVKANLGGQNFVFDYSAHTAAFTSGNTTITAHIDDRTLQKKGTRLFIPIRYKDSLAKRSVTEADNAKAVMDIKGVGYEKFLENWVKSGNASDLASKISAHNAKAKRFQSENPAFTPKIYQKYCRHFEALAALYHSQKQGFGQDYSAAMNLDRLHSSIDKQLAPDMQDSSVSGDNIHRVLKLNNVGPIKTDKPVEIHYKVLGGRAFPSQAIVYSAGATYTFDFIKMKADVKHYGKEPAAQFAYNPAAIRSVLDYHKAEAADVALARRKAFIETTVPIRDVAARISSNLGRSAAMGDPTLSILHNTYFKLAEQGIDRLNLSPQAEKK